MERPSHLVFLEISALALCLIIRETTHFQTFHQFEALALILNAMNVSNKGPSCAKRNASTFHFILSLLAKSESMIDNHIEITY